MNSSRRLYHKNNTFSKRPGVPQVASYLIFTLETVLFYLVVLPRLDSPAQAILGTFYSITLLSLVVSTLVASSCDPSDRVMIQHRNTSREEFDSFRKGCGIKLLYCDYCRSFVKEQSRHCRACDRCVQDFDHHCMWINNCVGGLNYRAFLAMILSAFSNLLLYVLSLITLTMHSAPSDYLPSFAAAWVSGGINSIFVILLINLILLHIYLINKGISTYEFIMAQREEQRKQKELEQRAKELPKIDSQKVAFKQEDNRSSSHNENNSNGHAQVREEDSSSDNVVRVRSIDSKPPQDHSSTSSISNEKRQKDFEKPSPLHKSVIFGQNELTEKSQNWQANERAEGGAQNQGQSQGESSVELSQLFTRNKSLKFIIGKNEFYRPHRTSREHVRQIKSKSMYTRQ